MKKNRALEHLKKEKAKEAKSYRVKFIDWEMLEKIAKGDKKVAKVLHELDELHHKYSGRQVCGEAKVIRGRLRRRGIYLSKLGHYGPRHD